MPIILRPHKRSESKPTTHFRDTIGDRLVAGVVLSVVMFGSVLIPWPFRYHFTFTEKLVFAALGFIGGFIAGDKLPIDRIIRP